MSGSKAYSVQTDEITLEALFAGQQYYWQVEAIFDDHIECSDVFTFQTEDVPRGISLGPVGNTRDIGGMRLETGGRIRQVMVYRGGLLEEMQDRDRLHQQSLYGIVTDLDLRLSRETGGKTISPLGEHIRYCNIAGPCYLGGAADVPGIEMPEGKAGLRDIFRLLAKAETYPVYIHCSIGRDRTGSVLMLLEGILGALEGEMQRDYEMSLFRMDPDVVGYVKEKYLPMLEWFASYGKGKRLAEHMECYLLDAGVTKEELDQIRMLLIERK